MKFLVSEKCGFCFGVEHAIELAQKMLAKQKHVYCLGDLIHNQQVVDRLSNAGLRAVEKIEQIPTPQKNAEQQPTVLIRSHGCHPKLIEQVKKLGFNLVDATCILVKRLQRLVRQLHEQGYKVILIGDPDHPEIQAVVGYAPEVTVIAGKDDLGQLPKTGKLAVVSQTTHSAEDFGRLVGLIATGSYDEIKVVNTICRETARRQAAAIELCRSVEVMFVLGSRHSANTRELAQLCQRNGVETHHLQGWVEFKPHYVEGKSVCGVTAGASTPDWVIKEFTDNLAKL